MEHNDRRGASLQERSLMEVGLHFFFASWALWHRLLVSQISNLHVYTPPRRWPPFSSCLFGTRQLDRWGGEKEKKKDKKPEQIQSCAEGNLENNLATITTRLWGGIKRNERDTLLSAAVHNWTKQFLSETDVVTWESAQAHTRWSNQQNAYQAISSPFCRTLLHNLIYFSPSVYKSLPKLLWILISRRRLDACPLRLRPL